MDSTASPQSPAPAEAAIEPDLAKRQAVATAIATELAPEVAIALLAKTEKEHPGDAEAALQPIAAGVSASDEDGKIRVQLMFENGTILPVELDKEAGLALIHGLQEGLNAAEAATSAAAETDNSPG